ncbi:putative serine dehydratase domain-containing protein [Chaetomium strumarium]|uniref:D-serine dehydratase n=1 Tax=Chaetomium strumarium TaxID=1170767 RepID=A0AAJ0H162_9PEZI|nr:putative serine dehydratase domain-containing protein [Chaetomium strumarium]
MAATVTSTEVKEQLRARFAGKRLNEVPTPSVVLDLAKLEVNCQRMLEATDRLGLLWRAHIKSHKTTELTRLQVGDSLGAPVSLIVSTILEAENILPLLKEYQSRGRPVNVLFSFPLFPTAVDRLAAFTAALGGDSLSVMIDHPSQLQPLAAITRASTHRPLVFLKIDTSYGRAGVAPPPSSSSSGSGSGSGGGACAELVDAVLAAERAGTCVLHGVYSHAGHSYAARDGLDDVLGYLEREFAGLAEVARLIEAKRKEKEKEKKLVLSVGATPTAMVVQHGGFLEDSQGSRMGEVKKLVERLRQEGFALEVHAGVYPTLDLQQLATHARDASLMTADDIAISVVAEVASLYPGRGTNGTTEALINAGTLALGREPVADKGKVPGHDYSGWGLLMPWGLKNPLPGPEFPRVHQGWQVGRISQEHGILVWQGKREDEVPLCYGQRVRVWPNHSCITGACFDWYLVVDSRNTGREDEVIDVWPRWRGW